MYFQIVYIYTLHLLKFCQFFKILNRKWVAFFLKHPVDIMTLCIGYLGIVPIFPKKFEPQTVQHLKKELFQYTITFLNPMSGAYSLKHCLHRLRPYFLIIPCLFEQTRLQKKKTELNVIPFEDI